ncbi:MAG: hypothetical protein UF329_05580 [Bulleidia sp.]|nr:hypothetical protein [Bulleidia sp.]
MLNYNPSWFKCKLYNFLIYLIASALFLSGCDIQKEHHANISEDIVSPIQQASFCTNIFAAVSDEAMYYQIEGGKLFALDKKGNNIQIGTMNFVDDKEAGSSRDGIPAPKRYSDIAGTGVGMLYFDRKIIYESEYFTVDGQMRNRLNAYDPTNNQFQTILEFDFQPAYFTLQKDVIAVAETIASSREGIVHFFDLNGNEKKVIKFGSDVVNITSNGNDIIINCVGYLYSVDIDTLEQRTLVQRENTAFVYVNDNTYSYYSIDAEELEKEIPQVHSGIIDNSRNTELFGVDNAIIDYYDDENIYTTTLENKVKYRIYDWNGNLVDEIIPSETLGASDGAIPTAYLEMDYSNIVRVWNEQLIAYHFHESEIELLSCSLKTHACEFLKS